MRYVCVGMGGLIWWCAQGVYRCVHVCTWVNRCVQIDIQVCVLVCTGV